MSAKRTILLVPGFVADTYSEIEASFVELCSDPTSAIQFLWVVPTISHRYTRCLNPNSQAMLREPLYVSHLRKSGIPFIVANISKFNLFANFATFRRIFREYKVDAVYTHFGFERFWAVLFGRAFGKVTIWNEHWHSMGTRFSLAKWVFYRLFVDYFISVSNFITRSLPKQSKIFTVPNSIRFETSRVVEKQQLCLKERLGIPLRRTIVSMVAAFTPQKRHALAITVCKKVLSRRKDIVFVFLGEGDERESVVRQIGELDAHDCFVLPGHVNNVDEYYSVSDICMFTGYNDAFGYAILEGMKHRLPTVAFASGGPAEIIRDQETGFLIDEADTELFATRLLELVEDRTKRSLLGENAFKVVEREYGREVWLKRMRAVLKEVVM